ncbi:MAG: zf-HC2 domain-containing protein [Acidobacteriota bacterium]|jgi:anti-sigma factor RsiW
MKCCDELLDRLEEAATGRLPTELDRHLRECPHCQESAARWQAVNEAVRTTARTVAPPELVARLKRLPRFPVACETTLDLLGDALTGALPAAERTRFLVHLQQCASCRTTWEALATLREVGLGTVAPPRLRATAALPPRQRLAVRRRRGLFDLRLAVAAAYLFAALTVVLAGSPGSPGDGGGARIASVATFARAAVENRIVSYSRRLQEHVSTAGDWVSETVRETWQQVQQRLFPRRENHHGESNV